VTQCADVEGGRVSAQNWRTKLNPVKLNLPKYKFQVRKSKDRAPNDGQFSRPLMKLSQGRLEGDKELAINRETYIGMDVCRLMNCSRLQ